MKSRQMPCCDVSSCAKCLLVACKNDDCPTHTIDLKIKQFAYRISGHKHDAEGETEKRQEKVVKELERLKTIHNQRNKT